MFQIGKYTIKAKIIANKSRKLYLSYFLWRAPTEVVWTSIYHQRAKYKTVFSFIQRFYVIVYVFMLY